MPTSRYGIDVTLPTSRRSRSSRRFQWVRFRVLLLWIAFAFLALILSLTFLGINTHLPESSNLRDITATTTSNTRGKSSSNRKEVPSRLAKRRKLHVPCEIPLAKSVNFLKDPQDYETFAQFSLNYTEASPPSPFGGYQSLKQRESSFNASNQTINCGFISPQFSINSNDKRYMNKCKVVVSSCIFGFSDFLRTPTRSKVSIFSKQNVCFVMFVDSETNLRLKAEGTAQNEEGYIGLWRVIVVTKLPFEDMRRNGKIPKFLSHRLFPKAKYSVWVDSKMRLNADPIQIIEYFLWRNGSEYAISNHYDRHCVWDEVAQNKRLNKYNHTAIDQQFRFYQADGLVRFNRSGSIPSYVPEGSFIVRAHTPMSNLFSCLWFNEVVRFTPRDQLSFGYVYLKLTRSNPHSPFRVNMFKDCERRALAKLFHHRVLPN